MSLSMEFEQEEDGRWIAEIPELPGVMVYGTSKETLSQECRRSLCAWSRISWNAIMTTNNVPFATV
jgi:hypothetical protein